MKTRSERDATVRLIGGIISVLIIAALGSFRLGQLRANAGVALQIQRERQATEALKREIRELQQANVNQVAKKVTGA